MKIPTPSGIRIDIYKVNRFTTIPVLLDMLSRKKLVLLDPTTWDDKNDSEIMEVYKNLQGVEKLFALCCSYGDETIHHWKTFSDGISGCCIEFDAEKLIALLAGIGGVRFGPVEYRTIGEVKPGSIAVKKHPVYQALAVPMRGGVPDYLGRQHTQQLLRDRLRSVDYPEDHSQPADARASLRKHPRALARSVQRPCEKNQ